MNKLIAVGHVMLFVVMMLAVFGGASAATIRPPSDVTSTGGSVTNGIVTNGSITKTVKNMELVMTVIKNEKTEVSGNLFGGLGSAALSLSLLDSPSGNYGFLDISADGVFRYALKNDLPQVQALGVNELAKDIFRYQLANADGFITDATLTIFVLGNPSVSFDNVEIEFNNNSGIATPLHAGNAHQEGQHMRGQLTTASDRDWFVFSSLGDEIIHLELCPEGSQCVDEKGWVLYVFDADKLTPQVESATIPLRRFINVTDETLSVTPTDHMYLLLNHGIFNDSLIGIIDPCFGDRRTLDIGVGATTTPKNYLVAISSPLLRSSALDAEGKIKDNIEGCGSGAVVNERVVATLPDNSTEIIQQFITAFPFSEDQYTLKVTRTGADPFAVIPSDNTLFDSLGRKLSIAKMRINEQLFAVELEQLATTTSDAPAIFAIQSMESLNEVLVADPFLPTYNPANQIAKFPQVLDLQSDTVFSAEMQYQPEDNTLILLKAVPVNAN